MERMKEAIDAYVARGRVKMAEALADGRHRVVPRFEDLLTVGEAMLRHLVEERLWPPPGHEANALGAAQQSANESFTYGGGGAGNVASSAQQGLTDPVGDKLGKPKRIAKPKKAE